MQNEATTAAGSAADTGLPPVHDARARVLILGSFPGIASLTARAYYAHPRNQLWPILSALLQVPLTSLAYPARLDAVRSHGIAIWDVVDRCRRDGSLDAAIRDATANDFEPLLGQLPELRLVAFNGRLAARSLPWFAARGYETITLPSTSPAYAGLRFEQKLSAWRAITAPLRRPAPD